MNEVIHGKGEYIEIMVLNDREIVDNINREECQEDLEAIALEWKS